MAAISSFIHSAIAALGGRGYRACWPGRCEMWLQGCCELLHLHLHLHLHLPATASGVLDSRMHPLASSSPLIDRWLTSICIS
jgi:hypothetical protein